jgi:hypothetical protein
LRASGDVVLKLKTPFSDGTSHLLFSGLEFVEKLAALIPPPRIHLTHLNIPHKPPDIAPGSCSAPRRFEPRKKHGMCLIVSLSDSPA